MSFDALQSNSGNVSSTQVTTIQTSVDNIKQEILSPAGPLNTSKYVYEDIAGVRVKAWAITGSESRTSLLSAANAEQHWLWESHGEIIPWRVEYSHLLREGMLVVVVSNDGGAFKFYRVKAGTTVAQRAENPTDPTIAEADNAYEPWSFT